jgi:hypothetical protein
MRLDSTLAVLIFISTRAVVQWLKDILLSHRSDYNAREELLLKVAITLASDLAA